MKLIQEQVKRLLDRNALVLAGFALLGIIMSSTVDASAHSEVGLLVTLMKQEELLILFIVIVTELAKSSVIQDKQSKRMEFLLANGVRPRQLIGQYTSSLYLTTLVLLLPALMVYVISAFFQQEKGLLAWLGVTLFIVGLLDTLLVVYYILYTVNLNKLNGIQMKAILFSILLMMISFALYQYYPMIECYLGIKLVILTLAILIISRLTTTERIVRSYY
ncbi:MULTISPECIES: hypothetical protein [Aerococcus]|uniref:Uncharacterized protein n=3 Tax=Aerococcus TaxID=1375 RepID=A0A178HEA5_9LACT|nr:MULTISPECIES: hypothetical protein [Aerococcus]MCY3026318.1 hypothetical protein [Aerococcus loyolae]MCY3027250.1 hypothetical protein [Aerococcus loyolae]MCY3028872.1 hypothetical protein [Aerococcus loyolae]MDK6728361.1 hypothetical protein [Aerococcus urinae]MDK7910417.1 hypothetical protein [Aerococcus urinae]